MESTGADDLDRNDQPLIQDEIEERFMRAPSKAVIHGCISGFIDRTLNQALAMQICAVCARELPSDAIKQQPLHSIPNVKKLIPFVPHAIQAADLIEGNLFH
jgi:hypothetical protein